MWHDSIARGDHECVEGVMESNCALADSNTFIAESNMHCDTDAYVSDSNMCIAGSSSSSMCIAGSSSSCADIQYGLWQ